MLFCFLRPSSCRYDRSTFYSQGEEGYLVSTTGISLAARNRGPQTAGSSGSRTPPGLRRAPCSEQPCMMPQVQVHLGSTPWHGDRRPPLPLLTCYLTACRRSQDYPFLEQTEEGKAFLQTVQADSD